MSGFAPFASRPAAFCTSPPPIRTHPVRTSPLKSSCVPPSPSSSRRLSGFGTDSDAGTSSAGEDDGDSGSEADLVFFGTPTARETQSIARLSQAIPATPLPSTPSKRPKIVRKRDSREFLRRQTILHQPFNTPGLMPLPSSRGKGKERADAPAKVWPGGFYERRGESKDEVDDADSDFAIEPMRPFLFTPGAGAGTPRRKTLSPSKKDEECDLTFDFDRMGFSSPTVAFSRYRHAAVEADEDDGDDLSGNASVDSLRDVREQYDGHDLSADEELADSDKENCPAPRDNVPGGNDNVNHEECEEVQQHTELFEGPIVRAMLPDDVIEATAPELDMGGLNISDYGDEDAGNVILASDDGNISDSSAGSQASQSRRHRSVLDFDAIEQEEIEVDVDRSPNEIADASSSDEAPVVHVAATEDRGNVDGERSSSLAVALADHAFAEAEVKEEEPGPEVEVAGAVEGAADDVATKDASAAMFHRLTAASQDVVRENANLKGKEHETAKGVAEATETSDPAAPHHPHTDDEDTARIAPLTATDLGPTAELETASTSTDDEPSCSSSCASMATALSSPLSPAHCASLLSSPSSSSASNKSVYVSFPSRNSSAPSPVDPASPGSASSALSQYDSPLPLARAPKVIPRFPESPARDLYHETEEDDVDAPSTLSVDGPEFATPTAPSPSVRVTGRNALFESSPSPYPTSASRSANRPIRGLVPAPAAAKHTPQLTPVKRSETETPLKAGRLAVQDRLQRAALAPGAPDTAKKVAAASRRGLSPKSNKERSENIRIAIEAKARALVQDPSVAADSLPSAPGGGRVPPVSQCAGEEGKDRPTMEKRKLMGPAQRPGSAMSGSAFTSLARKAGERTSAPTSARTTGTTFSSNLSSAPSSSRPPSSTGSNIPSRVRPGTASLSMSNRTRPLPSSGSASARSAASSTSISAVSRSIPGISISASGRTSATRVPSSGPSLSMDSQRGAASASQIPKISNARSGTSIRPAMPSSTAPKFAAQKVAAGKQSASMAITNRPTSRFGLSTNPNSTMSGPSSRGVAASPARTGIKRPHPSTAPASPLSISTGVAIHGDTQYSTSSGRRALGPPARRLGDGSFETLRSDTPPTAVEQMPTSTIGHSAPVFEAAFASGPLHFAVGVGGPMLGSARAVKSYTPLSHRLRPTVPTAFAGLQVNSFAVQGHAQHPRVPTLQSTNVEPRHFVSSAAEIVDSEVADTSPAKNTRSHSNEPSDRNEPASSPPSEATQKERGSSEDHAEVSFMMPGAASSSEVGSSPIKGDKEPAPVGSSPREQPSSPPVTRAASQSPSNKSKRTKPSRSVSAKLSALSRPASRAGENKTASAAITENEFKKRTLANTKANEKRQCSIDRQVIHIDLPRPPSPTSKIPTTADREERDRKMGREERARRRKQDEEDAKATQASLMDLLVKRVDRDIGPGEDEAWVYEDPEDAQSLPSGPPRKRVKTTDERDTATKRVKWDRGVVVIRDFGEGLGKMAKARSETGGAGSSRTSESHGGGDNKLKSALSVERMVDLDQFGNVLTSATKYSIKPQKVVVQAIFYQGEEPYVAPVAQSGKGKKKSA